MTIPRLAVAVAVAVACVCLATPSVALADEPSPAPVPVAEEEPPAPLPPPSAYVTSVSVEPPATPNLPVIGGGSARFSVGVGARTLYKVPMGGVDFGLALGGWGPRGAWYITSDLLAGASSERLTTVHFQLGIVVESKISTRFRFGVGASNGVLLVQRATNNRYMSQFTFTTFLRLSYDVLQWRNDGALFVGLQAGPGWAAPATIVFAGTIGVGIRL